MNGFLLDTNILSELRKGPKANSNVLRWYSSTDDAALFTSVLVLGEIRKGIELIRARDKAQAQSLDRWLSGLRSAYQDRIMSVTDQIAERWGQLSALRPIPVTDGLLAATALSHSLTLVTRNDIDLRGTGVKIVNPF